MVWTQIPLDQLGHTEWCNQQDNNAATLSPEGPEVRNISALATGATEPADIEERLCYFSSWHQAKRTIAVCLRLKETLTAQLRESNSTALQESKPKGEELEVRGQINRPISGLDRLVKESVINHSKEGLKHHKITKQKGFTYKPVNFNELQEAEREIIRKVQNKAFGDEIALFRHLCV